MERLEERAFIATTETIRAARRFVRERAEATAIDPQTLADVELATSELVTNAIEYGSGDDYQVAIASAGDRFVIEVKSTNAGATLDMPAEWSPSDPETPSGRGLSLVKALSSNVWVRHADERIVVGCEFDIPAIGKIPLF